jgi:hypothetical protein
MSKRNAIFASILLILASIIIKILLKNSNSSLNIEFVSFFSGFLLGAGISFLIVTLFKKKPIQ